MSTELAPAPNSDLAIADGQTFWTERQVAALRQIGVGDAPNSDLAVFFHQSVRTGLDPFARQIYMIGRWSKDGTKYTIQVGIDGFRLIASRTGQLDGYEDTLWCGDDGAWRDVWLAPHPPSAAKVTVIRNGARFPAVALFREYAQTKRNGEYTQMWAEKGAIMIAKCAEALALRKAFPQDLSGLYTSDEMSQPDTRRVDSEQMQRPSPSLAAPEPQAEPVPADMAARIAESTDPEGLAKLSDFLPKKYGATDEVDDLLALIAARIDELSAPVTELGVDEAQATIADVLDADVIEDGEQA
ncbi:phage recombination protein Bet [Gordonia sp. (in: high G+C Gram-positive bacteria)]|uniref:phage recombination protein Bet n=1 Tax=Gordonia sp. (in: high G+C Gram-positive bacteria) TaxID=84139 RepID=UPI003F95C133